ncbi:MAG: hypothetical protein ACOCP8_10475 [archaeon]
MSQKFPEKNFYKETSNDVSFNSSLVGLTSDSDNFSFSDGNGFSNETANGIVFK